MRGHIDAPFRIALGARAPAVLQMMLLDGLRPAAIGLLLGLVGGALSAQLIRSVLFQVRALDLTVFGLVMLVVLAVALAAGVLPSVRATRVDPMVALRNE